MRISQAITKKILNLCDENNISVNKLTLMNGLTQFTLQSIICEKSENPKVLTIIRICYSFKI